MAAVTAERVDAALSRLSELYPRVIDLSLGRIERLLGALGDPQRRLPPVVHVAGTNGKGSVIAFLRAFLEATGARVHVYTSPHLVRFAERFVIAGREVSEDALVEALEDCEARNRDEPITLFEITTAAAFLLFAHNPADVVLLETGLGGRLDATNVVDRPAVTAITPISFDHTQFLGSTLTAIATEKAGILKPGVPAVFAPQTTPAVTEVLTRRAEAIAAPVVAWRLVQHTGGFRFEDPGHVFDLPQPALVGAHQLVNVGVAIACSTRLPLPVPELALLRGLRTVRWPGRLQRLTRGPLVDRLPPGWELWLDGGHNLGAGEALADQAATWAEQVSPLPLALIFGMQATKQPLEFLMPLAPHVARLRGVPVPGSEAALSAVQSAAAATAAGIRAAEPAATVTAALDDLITAVAARPHRVLVCGSLYLVGDLLRDHG